MCWKCGKPLEISGTVSRSDVCPDCGADVCSCRNCRFYEPGSHYDCHENIDELVKDKERANFCGWFSLRKEFSADSAKSGQKNDAKNAFDSLFGDFSPKENETKSAGDAFNALFKD